MGNKEGMASVFAKIIFYPRWPLFARHLIRYSHEGND